MVVILLVKGGSKGEPLFMSISPFDEKNSRPASLPGFVIVDICFFERTAVRARKKFGKMRNSLYICRTRNFTK